MFLAAYDLAPLPDILFNIGLAREKMLDFEGCVRDFRNYLKEGRDLELQGRARERLAHCQSLALVAVHATSIPSGAAIVVSKADTPAGGRFVGRTPAEIKLSLGSYLVRAELPGYRPAEENLNVDIGGPASLDFPLERLATLSVDADTSGATVQIGSDPPTALPTRRELLAGAYRVTVSKPGYRTASRDVLLGVGEQSTLVLDLPPLPQFRALSLHAEPDAALHVDGQAMTGTARAVALEQGPHHVEVVAPGARPYLRDLVIPANRDVVLEVTLAHTRARKHRLALFGLAAGAVAAGGAGAIFGMRARSDEAHFSRAPSLDVADEGQRHALLADVMFATALLLAGATLTLYWLTAPGESTGILR